MTKHNMSIPQKACKALKAVISMFCKNNLQQISLASQVNNM